MHVQIYGKILNTRSTKNIPQITRWFVPLFIKKNIKNEKLKYDIILNTKTHENIFFLSSYSNLWDKL